MDKLYICFILVFSFLFINCNGTQSQGQPSKEMEVKTGAKVLLDKYIDDLKGKRIGLVMNPTSRVEGVHMLDTLLSLDVNITALFAAEHGFRGQAGAGEKIENGLDQETGLPVYSLYGATRKPSPEMFEQVDLILFDLPDVGARFYTYSATMGYVVEAVAEDNKEIWILDRPNPVGGNYVAGWILEEQYKSFVGKYPMPIAYGLTMGELAKMAIGEEWLALETEPKLQIIKTAGWEREMQWPDTGLEWVAPSPNLPAFEHAFAYLGTVIFEGTNISEGRGTPNPFLTIGSPNFEFQEEELSALEIQFNVKLDSVSFIPESIPGKSISPKHEGEWCNGIQISFQGEYDNTDPVEMGLGLLKFVQTHTKDFEITSFANKLYGIDLQSIIQSGEPLPSWQKQVEEFKQKRKPYLLY